MKRIGGGGERWDEESRVGHLDYNKRRFFYGQNCDQGINTICATTFLGAQMCNGIVP